MAPFPTAQTQCGNHPANQQHERARLGNLVAAVTAIVACRLRGAADDVLPGGTARGEHAEAILVQQHVAQSGVGDEVGGDV